MNSPYVPDSCNEEPFTTTSSPEPAKCACGQPTLYGRPYCLAGMIEQDLNWVAHQIKLADGWVPWFRTPKFKEALRIARTA